MKTTVFHRPYPLWIKIILAVYMIAFAAATWNHVADIITAGMFPYDQFWDVPCWMNVYWTSLTLLDPLAIVVLLFYLRPGLLFYFLIMFSDVAINIYANYTFWKIPFLENYFLASQVLFLLFLCVTAPFILKHHVSSGAYQQNE